MGNIKPADSDLLRVVGELVGVWSCFPDACRVNARRHANTQSTTVQFILKSFISKLSKNGTHRRVFVQFRKPLLVSGQVDHTVAETVTQVPNSRVGSDVRLLCLPVSRFLRMQSFAAIATSPFGRVTPNWAAARGRES